MGRALKRGLVFLLALILCAVPLCFKGAFAASQVELKYSELESYIKKGNYDYKLALNQLDNVYTALDTLYENESGLDSQYRAASRRVSTLQSLHDSIRQDGFVSPEAAELLVNLGFSITTATPAAEACAEIQFAIGALSLSLGSLSAGILEIQSNVDTINKSDTLRKTSKNQVLEGYLMGARMSYCGLYMQMTARDIQRENLEYLESQRGANEVKMRLGLLSQSRFQDFLKSIETQKVALENLDAAIKKSEDSLKVMLGIPLSDKISLTDPSPGFDFSVISKIDSYADQAEYMKNNLAVKSAKEGLRLSEEEYGTSRTTAAEFALDKARLEVLKAESDAKVAYLAGVQAVKDAYRDLQIEAQDLQKLRDDLEKMTQKLTRGLVSRAQVRQTELSLEVAELNYAISRFSLYHRLQCYNSALKGGYFAG